MRPASQEGCDRALPVNYSGMAMQHCFERVAIKTWAADIRDFLKYLFLSRTAPNRLSPNNLQVECNWAQRCCLHSTLQGL